MRTVCPYCGVGCGMGLRVAGRRVAGVEPILSHPDSHGQLCAKGWSAAFGIDAGNRITTPLIRAGNALKPASWDEAFSYVADTLRAICEESGPDAIGIISSARATNEDNYAAQKFARAVIGTNNVDHCARICHSPSVAGLRQTLGSGAMTNSMSDVHNADLIVVFGADPTENHSVFGGQIIRAKANGAKLLVVDPRRTRLAKLADLHLQLRVGTNIALINGLLHIIFGNSWQNQKFLDARCEGWEAVREKVREYPPDETARITGVPAAQLEEAARMYSHANAAFLCYGMGITQHTTGTNNVIAVSNLVLSCGHIGRPGTGINPLRGQNNVQGACDMGALPNVYPGYQEVAEAAVREKFAKAWGVPVAENPGMTSLGMTKGALEGTTRAMLLMGEDPVVTDPDQNHVRRALQALDLFVVFELTLTETATLADVVFPAASFAEKEGTFTNCERRVQHIRPAVPPLGESRADWRILADLAERMGSDALNWNTSEEIFNEMASVAPLFAGMDYAKLDARDGLQWPCDAEHPEGTPFLHSESFSRGKGRLIPLSHRGPAETPDAEYPLCLTTNRLHYHYGCGSMTRKSPLLERETPDGVLFINELDAVSLGLQNHSPVRVSSRRGFLETRAVLTDQVPQGTVTIPYHFKEAPSNLLTNNEQDPVTKMPELKACAVRVEALPEGSRPRTAAELLQEGLQ